jgi:hypothetical protein
MNSVHHGYHYPDSILGYYPGYPYPWKFHDYPGSHVFLPRRQWQSLPPTFIVPYCHYYHQYHRQIHYHYQYHCQIHWYHYTIAKMSDSSLSPPPQSEISLPTLPPLSPTLQLRRTAKKPRLASIDSDLFTSGIFSRTLLETTLPTVQLRCLQPGCLYAPKPQLLSFNQTGNYWMHYYHTHPQVAEAFKPALKSSSSQGSQSYTNSAAKLFTPRLSKPNASATEAF